MVVLVIRGSSKRKEWLVNNSWKNSVVSNCCQRKFISVGVGVGMSSWSAARTCYFEGVMFIALSSSTRYKILHKAKASKTKHVVLGNFCSPLDSPRPKNASSNSLFMNGMQIKCHENFRETLFSQKWSKRINLLA